MFVLVGLAFKISAVPFHMWTPDVYEGAPTPVTVFFATAPKVAAMALLLRVMATPFGHLLGAWQLLIVLVSIASMVLGALAAIGQTNIKRLMAYSSIGHMGYALIGLAVGTPAGMRGVLVYMVDLRVHDRRHLRLHHRDAPQRPRGGADLRPVGPGATPIRRWRWRWRCSCSAWPASRRWPGFFAKLYIFLAAVQGGLWTLAVIGVLTSVVGAFYYIRIVKVMYFDAAGRRRSIRAPHRCPSSSRPPGCSPRSSSCSPARSSRRRRRRRRRCSDDRPTSWPGLTRPSAHDALCVEGRMRVRP